MKLYEFAVSGSRPDSPVRSFFGMTPEEARQKALAKFPNPTHVETGETIIPDVTGDENGIRWMGQSWFPHGAMTNKHVLGLPYEVARLVFELDRLEFIVSLLNDEE